RGDDASHVGVALPRRHAQFTFDNGKEGHGDFWFMIYDLRFTIGDWGLAIGNWQSGNRAGFASGAFSVKFLLSPARRSGVRSSRAAASNIARPPPPGPEQRRIGRTLRHPLPARSSCCSGATVHTRGDPAAWPGAPAQWRAWR